MPKASISNYLHFISGWKPIDLRHINDRLKAHLFLKAYPPSPFCLQLSLWCRNTLCSWTYEICLWNCSSAFESVVQRLSALKVELESKVMPSIRFTRLFASILWVTWLNVRWTFDLCNIRYVNSNIYDMHISGNCWNIYSYLISHVILKTDSLVCWGPHGPCMEFYCWNYILNGHYT